MITCAGYGERDFGWWLIDHCENGMKWAKEGLSETQEGRHVFNYRKCYTEFHRIRALALGTLIAWTAEQALDELGRKL